MPFILQPPKQAGNDLERVVDGQILLYKNKQPGFFYSTKEYKIRNCFFRVLSHFKGMQEDDPVVTAELLALHEKYEKALTTNDVDVLDALFWESSKVIRFGMTENLYGVEALREFRRNRPSKGLQREVVNVQVRSFGQDSGVTTVEFTRELDGEQRIGRQSQFWIRFPIGWRIVSAHVSYLQKG